MTTIEVKTADGVTLRIDRVVARGRRRGVVVCLHAMMTDGRYFGARKQDSFAAHLAGAGLDVIVADFRGHGRSTPPTARDGDWSFDDLVDFDLPAITAGIDPAELVIIGHSLGGLVAIAGLATQRIAPPRLLVIPATAPWLLGPRAPLRRRAVMATYRHATALLGYAPIRALRLGTADEPATYVRQLTGWARTARWTSLYGLDYRAAAHALTARIWPLTGAGDWMCTPADARDFLQHLPTAEPLRIAGREYGDAIDPDHFQLFTRRELRPLWDELIRKIFEARPGTAIVS